MAKKDKVLVLSDDLSDEEQSLVGNIRSRYYHEYYKRAPEALSAFRRALYKDQKKRVMWGGLLLAGGAALAAGFPLVAAPFMIAVNVVFWGGMTAESKFDRLTYQLIERDIKNGTLLDRYQREVLDDWKGRPAMNYPREWQETAIGSLRAKFNLSAGGSKPLAPENKPENKPQPPTPPRP